jgi:hypothetical protein
LRELNDPLALADATTVLRRPAMVTMLPHALQLHRVPAALLRLHHRQAQCLAQRQRAAHEH